MLKQMPFFKEVDDTLVSTAYQIKVKIPTFFFIEPKLAEDYGDKVSTLFIFDMFVQMTEDAKVRKFKVALPSELIFFYDVKEKEEENGIKYSLFTINKGTTFVNNLNIIQTATNMEKIFNIISSAKLTDVEYEKVVDIFFDAADINAANPGATPIVFEAVVAELARYKEDVSMPFRVALGKGIAKKDDYEFIRIKELPKINSVFSGIGFENINSSVQSGVVKTEKNKPQKISQLEKIAKY